jgi:hypothetical protein
MTSPFVKAAGATLGTVVAIGGVTLAVSNVTMIGIRAVVKQRQVLHDPFDLHFIRPLLTASAFGSRGTLLFSIVRPYRHANVTALQQKKCCGVQKKVAVTCKPCGGRKYQKCSVCSGTQMLRLARLAYFTVPQSNFRGLLLRVVLSMPQKISVSLSFGGPSKPFVSQMMPNNLLQLLRLTGSSCCISAATPDNDPATGPCFPSLLHAPLQHP